jgi:hypothetical protein
MELALAILLGVGALGAVDVLYFHLFRFRLFSRPESVAEEITHLVRHVLFLAVVILLSTGTRSAARDAAVVAVLGLDLLNSSADVLLERRSRAAIGGLPSAEYLVHVLSSFGTGVAAAAYFLAAPDARAPISPTLLAWQVRGVLALGVALLLFEGTLFARALRSRARTIEAALGPTPRSA